MCSGHLKLFLSPVVLQEGVCAFWDPTRRRGRRLGSLVVLGRVQQDVRRRRIVIHSPLRQPAVGVCRPALPSPGPALSWLHGIAVGVSGEGSSRVLVQLCSQLPGGSRLLHANPTSCLPSSSVLLPLVLGL